MEIQEVVSFNNALVLKLDNVPLDVHAALEESLGAELWSSAPYENLRRVVLKYAKSRTIENILNENSGLTVNAVLSLVYFTADIQKFKGAKTDNIYFLMNQALQSRDFSNITRWNGFVFYLFEAKEYLPKFRGMLLYTLNSSDSSVGTVYRSIDKPISEMYEEGHNVNWTSFSSTTTDENVIKAFSQKHSGTWMIIKGVTDGIQIPLSLFPNENEVLLFPNTTLRVDHLFRDI
jgi:hypothetical protein